jgi:hypothetical protein
MEKVTLKYYFVNIYLLTKKLNIYDCSAHRPTRKYKNINVSFRILVIVSKVQRLHFAMYLKWQKLAFLDETPLAAMSN